MRPPYGMSRSRAVYSMAHVLSTDSLDSAALVGPIVDQTNAGRGVMIAIRHRNGEIVGAFVALERGRQRTFLIGALKAVFRDVRSAEDIQQMPELARALWGDAADGYARQFAHYSAGAPVNLVPNL